MILNEILKIAGWILPVVIPIVKAVYEAWKTKQEKKTEPPVQVIVEQNSDLSGMLKDCQSELEAYREALHRLGFELGK